MPVWAFVKEHVWKKLDEWVAQQVWGEGKNRSLEEARSYVSMAVVAVF